MSVASFIHNFDPVIGKAGWFYLWWYGASYTLGFLGVFFWLRRVRRSLDLSTADIYALTILLAAGVLAGGRAVEVIFYEWDYYGKNLLHIPAVWLGGMSTHGILLGGVLSVWWFCHRRGVNFLSIADELAIAGAYVMGMGRIGNFIDGQIAGSVTDVWWAVQFPDLEGFRHPVVLYDGIKNLLLVPLLLFIRRFRPPRGALLGHFLFGYGFLRIFIDFFREYRTDFFGLPPGQEFNVCMSLAGIALLVWAHRNNPIRGPVRRAMSSNADAFAKPFQQASLAQRCAFTALLVLPMIIPSDWTQDVPARYSHRHEGLRHSFLYPPVAESTAPKTDGREAHHVPAATFSTRSFSLSEM